jgi:hypothetical protein
MHPEIKQALEDLDVENEAKSLPMIEQPTDLNLKLLPYQLEGVGWMLQQEQTEYKGGVLADEMGMGKTIQMIALLLSEPRLTPTLIIAPVVALIQWKNEIEKHANGLTAFVFHGAKRPQDPAELMKQDIVLTTYSIISSLYKRQKYGFMRNKEKTFEPSVLHKIHWPRIVLDEAHNIKDRHATQSIGVVSLVLGWLMGVVCTAGRLPLEFDGHAIAEPCRRVVFFVAFHQARAAHVLLLPQMSVQRTALELQKLQKLRRMWPYTHGTHGLVELAHPASHPEPRQPRRGPCGLQTTWTTAGQDHAPTHQVGKGRRLGTPTARCCRAPRLL